MMFPPYRVYSSLYHSKAGFSFQFFSLRRRKNASANHTDPERTDFSPSRQPDRRAITASPFCHACYAPGMVSRPLHAISGSISERKAEKALTVRAGPDIGSIVSD